MYENILSHTLESLKAFPTPIPKKSRLAGITDEYIAPAGGMYSGDNLHYSLGNTYLELGILGVAEKAAANAAKIADPVKKELLLAISEAYTELARYFARYAEALYAAAEGDERLLRMAENMAVLAKEAPQHFDQALQLEYIMWKNRCAFAEGFGACIGRMDVRTVKWFEKDIASGYLTEEAALDLLTDMWEMFNVGKSGDTLMNVMVGGKNPDGTDSSSRLSVLMLKATMRCQKSEPHINVRCHKNMRRDLYEAMLQVQLMGQGQASIYNDDVLIPSLIKFGVPEELAYRYANDGCTEVILDGCSTIDLDYMDAVGVFELAFNNGSFAERTYQEPIRYWKKDQPSALYTPHVTPGFASGAIEDCKTFDEFYQCFLKQYRYQLRDHAAVMEKRCTDFAKNVPASLLLNGTYDNILETGDDLLREGLPVHINMIFSGSITTVADCLIAVKKLVFEQKLYTPAEIREAIRVNFEGYDVMRAQMKAAPKFGNDIDEVDLLARDIGAHYCDYLDEYRKETGFAVMPSLIGYMFLEESYGVAATPDGRKYADPIAEHFCATPGKAENGPTAMINSICKSSDVIARCPGAATVHVSLPRNLGNSDEESLTILDHLVQAALAGKMNQMNIAIYDAELLREAQKDPENHQDLVVRVWGYSARFVDLCPEMQEHVISRITKVN